MRTEEGNVPGVISPGSAAWGAPGLRPTKTAARPRAAVKQVPLHLKDCPCGHPQRSSFRLSQCATFVRLSRLILAPRIAARQSATHFRGGIHPQ